jgi:hypothetical protein
MPKAKPTTLTEIAEIQSRMAQVRHDMHQEVQSAVKGAQLLTDWRSMVRNYPWLSLSVAALGGFAIVPRRRHTHPGSITSLTDRPELVAPTAAAPVQTKRRAGWSLVGTALSLLTPVAVRAAQNYALNHLENWLSHHPLPPAPTIGREPREDNGGQPDRKRPANRSVE